MKFEVPKNCGSCDSKKLYNAKFVCGMPTKKENEMLDISAFTVPLDSRPDWCPKKELINVIQNLSEEDKVLFDKMCEGILAMIELIGKNNANTW